MLSQKVNCNLEEDQEGEFKQGAEDVDDAEDHPDKKI